MKKALEKLAAIREHQRKMVEIQINTYISQREKAKKANEYLIENMTPENHSTLEEMIQKAMHVNSLTVKDSQNKINSKIDELHHKSRAKLQIDKMLEKIYKQEEVKINKQEQENLDSWSISMFNRRES